MKPQHTPGPWIIHHWNQGQSGVKNVGLTDGIIYYTGDAVNEKHFKIVSAIKDHEIQASFEGAHVAEITDFSYESQANARLIASAPDLLAACKAALVYVNYQIEFGSGTGNEGRLASMLQHAIERSMGPIKIKVYEEGSAE